MKIRKNIPKIIYLQISDDCDTNDFLEESRIAGNAVCGITWCENKINDNDIRYVLDKRHIKKGRKNEKDNNLRNATRLG